MECNRLFYNLLWVLNETQGRRHGGHSGAVPPKRGLCPEEINRIGAAGVQIEAEIGVWHQHIGCFCGLTPILQNFWDEDFFLEVTYFRVEKPFEFLYSAKKSLWISVKTFFFFGSHLVRMIQTGINCSCPSQIHINKLLVPPKISFCPPSPPQSRYPGAGPDETLIDCIQSNKVLLSEEVAAWNERC